MATNMINWNIDADGILTLTGTGLVVNNVNCGAGTLVFDGATLITTKNGGFASVGAASSVPSARR